MGARYSQGQGYRNPGNQTARPAPMEMDPAVIRAIVVDGNVEKLVELADQVGRALVDQKLTTSQIRNVFGTVRQIQLRWSADPDKSYRDAVLLRPKLAYYATREKNSKNHSIGMETLQSLLNPALLLMSSEGLDSTQRQVRFERIVDLFEAVVAYHKKYGGRDS